MPTRNPETGNRSAVCFLAGYIVAAPEAGNQSQAGCNIRKPYNCASTSGDERIFCRRPAPWADPISRGLPSATTSIPTCIPYSMTCVRSVLTLPKRRRERHLISEGVCQFVGCHIICRGRGRGIDRFHTPFPVLLRRARESRSCEGARAL